MTAEQVTEDLLKITETRRGTTRPKGQCPNFQKREDSLQIIDEMNFTSVVSKILECVKELFNENLQKVEVIIFTLIMPTLGKGSYQTNFIFFFIRVSKLAD